MNAFIPMNYKSLNHIPEENDQYHVNLHRHGFTVDNEHPGGQLVQTNLALDRNKVMRAQIDSNDERRQEILEEKMLNSPLNMDPR